MPINNRKPTVCNTRSACELAGTLIDRSLLAEREFLAAAMINPNAALRAAVEVDLRGIDFVADHHSALFWWISNQCADRGQPWNAAAFTQTARAAGIDVDGEDVDDIEFRHDAFPKMLPTLAAAVKSYADQRRDAQGHFKALDTLGARLDDRRIIDAVYMPKTKAFTSPRQRKAGRYV